MSDNAKIIIEGIIARRSYPPSKMIAGALPDGDLQLLLECANWAPSHKHTEPWRFRIYRDKGKQLLADNMAFAYREWAGDKVHPKKLEKYLTRPQNASVLLAIIVEPSQRPVMPFDEEIMAVSCAVQNLHIAAQAMGYAGFWTSPAFLDHDHLRSFFELSGCAKCIGVFYLGTPSGPFPVSVRRPVSDKVVIVDGLSD